MSLLIIVGSDSAESHREDRSSGCHGEVKRDEEQYVNPVNPRRCPSAFDQASRILVDTYLILGLCPVRRSNYEDLWADLYSTILHSSTSNEDRITFPCFTLAAVKRLLHVCQYAGSYRHHDVLLNHC